MLPTPGIRLLPRSARALGAALLVLGLSGAARAESFAAPPSPLAANPESTTPTLGEALKPSGPDQMALSEYLRRKGILFYGAWWCPACFKQKSLFGKEAGNRLPYVECEKTQSDRERCQAAGIRAYPTWIQGDKRIEGVQTIEELKQWSGFPSGSRTP